MSAVRLERCRPASERGRRFRGPFPNRSGLASRLHETHCDDGWPSWSTSRGMQKRGRSRRRSRRQRNRSRRKRGRPRKGEARAKEPTGWNGNWMSLPQMLADLPRACDVGSKRNAKGHTTSWIGYKLHVDTADGGIPISCIMTSASRMTPSGDSVGDPDGRTGRELYDLMDAAYDSIEIWAHCILLGHKPIIDVNPAARRARGIEAGEEGAAHARSRLSRGASLRRALDRRSMGGSRMSSAAAMSACAGTQGSRPPHVRQPC